MIAHTVVFASAVGVLVTGLLSATSVAALRRRPLGRHAVPASFEAILSRLQQVNRDKVALIANDFEEMGEGSGDSLESWQIFELVGGLAGLETISANCTVLIDLACHVQRWYPEALPVAEQLRLNAREIQWHIERLQGAERRGNLETAFPDYAQRAVTIYYGMTQHVLRLYEISQLPGFAQLEAAL